MREQFRNPKPAFSPLFELPIALPEQADLPEPEADARQALASALLTPPDALTPAQREWLAVLQR